MPRKVRLDVCAHAIALILLGLAFAPSAEAQTPNCVPPSNQQIIIYRAGSLSRAFKPLEAAFTCQTGIQVKDMAMGSVDAGRQITAGEAPCDLYAPADYSVIDLFMKPAGYADFNIVFARGKMVLAYSARALAEKKLPPITESDSAPFHPPSSIPQASAKWYEILMMPGVVIGGGHPVSRPGRISSRHDLSVGGEVLQGSEPIQQFAEAPGDSRTGRIIPDRRWGGFLIFSLSTNTARRQWQRPIRISAT